MKIINEINELLTTEQLDELLLDEKYNKSNLRELVRRLIYVMKGDKQHIKALHFQIEQLHKTIDMAAKELGYFEQEESK